MKRCATLMVAILAGACAGPDEILTVKQFQLRDTTFDRQSDPLVRNEKVRRLHGAISASEQRDRLGQYYTVLWNDPEGAGTGVPEIVFEYQQGGSASRIKRMTSTFESSAGSGRAEFSVTGDDYFEGGRVLAWKATLRRGDRVLATRQSYLWQ